MEFEPTGETDSWGRPTYREKGPNEGPAIVFVLILMVIIGIFKGC